jgi:hypothetical protein
MTPTRSKQSACGNAVCPTWANGCSESCNTSTTSKDRVDQLKLQVVGTREAAAGRRLKEDRKRQQQERAAASRASYGGGRRAPPESDG